MTEFSTNAGDVVVRRYQSAGSRAVSLALTEIMEIWDVAADAWCHAARMVPRADWQPFAQQRARTYLRRSRTLRKDDGRMVTGVLVRLNKKTVTVHTENGERWNVSPLLLTPVECPLPPEAGFEEHVKKFH